MRDNIGKKGRKRSNRGRGTNSSPVCPLPPAPIYPPVEPVKLINRKQSTEVFSRQRFQAPGRWLQEVLKVTINSIARICMCVIQLKFDYVLDPRSSAVYPPRTKPTVTNFKERVFLSEENLECMWGPWPQLVRVTSQVVDRSSQGR